MYWWECRVCPLTSVISCSSSSRRSWNNISGWMSSCLRLHGVHLLLCWRGPDGRMRTNRGTGKFYWRMYGMVHTVILLIPPFIPQEWCNVLQQLLAAALSTFKLLEFLGDPSDFLPLLLLTLWYGVYEFLKWCCTQWITCTRSVWLSACTQMKPCICLSPF